MNRSRYEALPNSSSSPPILLDLINNPSYNYNSGTATSVRTSTSSSHRPSITSISSRTPPPSFHSSQLAHLNGQSQPSQALISSFSGTSNYFNGNGNGAGVNGTTPFPSYNNGQYIESAPPSFHSRSSTPRPTPSTRTLASNVSGSSGVELWGVATTTSGGDETGEDREGASGLMIVKGLERRMERLEESIGRLLLENEELRNLRTANAAAGALGENQRIRQNCCVTFTDASREMEEALVMNGHNNCCVRFSSAKSPSYIKQRKSGCFVAIVLVAILVTLFVVMVIVSLKEGEGKGW
ncbi:1d918b43-a18f-4697-ba00-3f3d3298d8f9 [Sclerotinia trifoliorum]|uniref:1d918b43-a18f-4697-ba00-3f3d3298d8f9 n=1 Tax=Sclerotinia trifoliorum TaxID=28548 RepID=A0A8H2W279_9HELO|nr:1d918b43-a18f-4697-ba00-3f3d3298d8f9 [Sclerotinia trifoliorum]